MKVDIIKDCKFSKNGFQEVFCKPGQSNVDMPEDIALAFIGYGFVQEHSEKKSIVSAPENKMIKDAPENKEATEKEVLESKEIKKQPKKKTKKASK